MARNKWDLASCNGEDEGGVAYSNEHEPEMAVASVKTSALTGDGVQQLRDALVEMVHSSGGESESGMLTSLRHYEAIAEAIAALDKATEAAHQQVPHEMLLLDLYGALRQLDSLTGETTADDILNRIFSSFCIGK